VLAPDPSDPRIRATLRLRRGDFDLAVDLDLPGRGVTALFGPSGSGKTTCLRLLSGLDRAAGTVDVLGDVWQDDERGVFLPVHRRGCGFVFQDAALLSHLSVRENLAYARRRARRPARIDPAFVVAMAGLDSLLDRRPSQLSGGERKRAAIAQALLAEPKVLLMDEPLAGIDHARKRDIVPYLERLRDELSIPVVLVTHALDEVARLASHVVLMERGRVTASGGIEQILSRTDLAIAGADDAGAVIEATVLSHDDESGLTRVEFPGGALWIARVDRPPGAAVRVRALARDVSLALSPPGPSSILNVLEAEVVEIADHGPHQVHVGLVLGSARTRLVARITRRSREALDLRPGASVHAMIKSVALSA
jgi:molybdate transport system ATP-binding protein